MTVNEAAGVVPVEQPVDLDQYEVPVVAEIGEALRRALTERTRVALAEDGQPVAAVIPIEDLYLLLRLEDEELDRIDLEEIRKAEAEPGGQEFIPWEQIKADLDL